MSQKEIAFKIEELQIDATKINSLQEALYAAIFCQEDFAQETYQWAFILLGDMTMKLMDELEVLTNEAFGSYGRDVA